MLRIGVLADTHFHGVKEGVAFLEELAARYWTGVDIILHAGDLVNPDILMAFPDKVVHAVRGNMDPPAGDLPERRIITVNGFRIGLIHGWGEPDSLEEKILPVFRGHSLDCLVYGHSHRPACHVKDDILLFNPCRPTDRRRAPFHSVGILELGEKLSGRIVRIDVEQRQPAPV